MFLLNHEFINSINFLFHNIAFSLIVSLIQEFGKKKIIMFTILTTAITLSLKYIFSISNIELFKLLNTLVIFMNCVSILKIDIFDSLIITLTYSFVNFIVNIISFSFNLSISSDYYILCQTFIYTFVISYFYKCFYTPQIKELFKKFKNCMFENLDVYLLLLVLALSYDFSAIPNDESAFMSLLSQLLMIICIIQIIRNKIKFSIINTHIMNLVLENEKSRHLLDNVRVFKHDYGNTLCSIGGYISLNDMSGLKKFYSKVTEDFSASNNLQKINTISINEPSIYNLFASKYKTILKNNLKFDFYSTINYKKLYISSYDLPEF